MNQYNPEVKNRKAYSYQRFSSLKQKSGDSVRRQNQAALDFCKQYKLLLTDTFRDEGVSGFRGKNFSNESALGAFLKLVNDGVIPKGSVLILENMDRLSRQSILPCLSKFTQIIESGISIGVLSLNKILSVESVTDNMSELMMVLVEFSRAHNESQTKSIRIKSVFNAKIERMKKGERIYLSQMPGWITGLENGKFVLDETKVSLIKEMFTRFLAGHSCNHIAKIFNEEKMTTISGIKGSSWQGSTVSNLLKSKHVIGWYRMELVDKQNGDGQTLLNAFESDNYLPQIISHKIFQLTQQKLNFNVTNRGGSKFGNVRNLFKGLLRCAECGKLIDLHTHKYVNVKGQTMFYSRYYCRKNDLGGDCSNKGIMNVKEFETNFFDFIIMAKVHNLPSSNPKHQNLKLTSLENELAKVEMRIERVVKLLETDELSDMAELSKSLVTLKRERDKLKRDIESEKANTITKEHAPKAVKSLLELKRKETLGVTITETSEREKARNLMPQLYNKITLKFDKDKTTAEFYGVDGSKDTMTLKR